MSVRQPQQVREEGTNCTSSEVKKLADVIQIHDHVAFVENALVNINQDIHTLRASLQRLLRDNEVMDSHTLYSRYYDCLTWSYELKNRLSTVEKELAILEDFRTLIVDDSICNTELRWLRSLLRLCRVGLVEVDVDYLRLVRSQLFNRFVDTDYVYF